MPVLFVSEPGVGVRPHRFERRAVIGRDQGNDIRLTHPTVSGHHALVFVLPDGSLALKDLRSSNGCRVGGKQVRACRLEDGDIFYVGDLRVRYQGEREEADPMVTVDWELMESTDPALVTGPLQVQSPAAPGDMRTLQGQAKALLAMYALTNAVHSTDTEDDLFQAVGRLVQHSVGANQGALVEHNPDTGRLATRFSWPEGHEMVGEQPYARNLVNRVLRDGQTIIVPEDTLAEDGGLTTASPHRSVLCAPLRCRDRALGIIFATRDNDSFEFDDRHVQLLTAIGLEAGTALDNRRLYHELERDFFATVRMMVQALNTRDAYTGGHAQRVALISVAIARCIPLKAEHVSMVRLGALLHDVGKIGVEDRCLIGTEKLSDEDYAHIKRHTIRGDEMLSPVHKLEPMRTIVRHHHERWDGAGYPDGLEGERIPLAARIVAVADTLDAIVSNRSYREGQTLEAAMAEIERVAGSQLDPSLMPALRRARQQGFIRKTLWGSASRGRRSES